MKASLALPKVTRRTATASSLLLAVVAVSGCGGTPSTGGAPATAPPGVTAGQTAAPAAELNFTARTVTGATFDGRQLAGKPAVLWFWSPWCPTCRAQAPGVSVLAEKYAGKVSVIGVGGLDDSGAIRDYGPVITTAAQIQRHLANTVDSLGLPGIAALLALFLGIAGLARALGRRRQRNTTARGATLTSLRHWLHVHRRGTLPRVGCEVGLCAWADGEPGPESAHFRRLATRASAGRRLTP